MRKAEILSIAEELHKRGLPDCMLLEALFEKQVRAGAIGLDLIAALGDFAKIVRDQVSYMVELFPEFTPHDKTNHLNPLLQFASQMLGAELINYLSIPEISVLAASLYGPDWGMSVSPTERPAILNRAKGIASLEEFSLVKDEATEFERFLQSAGLNISDCINEDQIPRQVWKDYI